MQNTTAWRGRATGCRVRRSLVWGCAALLLLFSDRAIAQAPYSGSQSRPPHSHAQHFTMVLEQAESDFHYLLSQLLQFSSNKEQNYLNRAVAELRRALRTRSQSGFLYLELARLYVKLGQLSAALQACERAVQLAPQWHEAHSLLGRIHTFRRDSRAAQVAFRKSITLQPDQEAAYLHLGSLFSEAGRRDEAIEVFRELLQVVPGSTRGMYSLARVFAEDGNHEEAERYLKDAVAEQPHF